MIVPKGGTDAPCLVIDEEKMRTTGALAVYPEVGRLRLVGAKLQGGARLWTAQPTCWSKGRT